MIEAPLWSNPKPPKIEFRFRDGDDLYSLEAVDDLGDTPETARIRIGEKYGISPDLLNLVSIEEKPTEIHLDILMLSVG